uniref:Vitellogenin domain-containing protein n=1 Tax=Cynoglossus semilaevis TaxID=244447 RepID=A0A3P8X4F2_CYNSE
ESFSGAIGTDTLSGPKVSCKVLDVPQTCRFILSTTDCSLSSISALDAEGRPVYRPAVGSEAFKDAMAKNVLKIAIDGEDHVQLYPEDKEPENILNIKRGIINALLSPEVVEDVTRDMPTVYGTCPSTITVKDTDSGVTVLRDVHKCSAVDAKKMHTSPLALITGMEFRLSRMISSKQTCDYKFDNQKKVMTHCSCTEKHLFQPLSSQGSHGLTADVKQTLVLRDTIKINDRTFEPSKHLFHQNKDSVIMTLQRLSSLSQTPDGQERAGLFNNLLSELRGLKTEALTSAAVEMMEISGSLTVQALVQCGTPECTGAFLKVLKTFDNGPVAVDATVYALGMLQGPSDSMVMDMLDMARHRKSRPVMYALVYKFITSILGTDCAGEKELTYLTLRVLGNIGDVMEAVDPAIKNTLVKCMRQPATTLSVQLAAIQAFRLTRPCLLFSLQVRSNLRRVSQYPNGAVQKRLAAYLVLMKNPLEGDMEMVKKLLLKEQNTQVKTFVSSHIYNIISSTDPDLQMIREAVQDIDIYTDNDFRNSQNYNLSLGYESVQAAVFSNIIFDPSSQLPREVMLETTLKAFGFYANIWEVGMEGKGFEPSIEALFGNNGFFPDTVSKAIYWAEDKMPPNMKEVLEKWVAPFKTPGQKEIVRNFNKLMKDLQSQESPEAIAYLRSMGEELGYIKAADLKSMSKLLLSPSPSPSTRFSIQMAKCPCMDSTEARSTASSS